LIWSLHEGDENFLLQDKGSIDKYLVVDIKQRDASSFELTQPFLIERITKFLGIDNGKTNEKLTPVGKPLLNKDLDSVPRKYDWEYQGAIELTYLTGSVRPDIAMAVHQCARFSANPMSSHKQAIMRIGRYLLSAQDREKSIRQTQPMVLKYMWMPTGCNEYRQCLLANWICYSVCWLSYLLTEQTSNGDCIING
jgi:hypothetical protein